MSADEDAETTLYEHGDVSLYTIPPRPPSGGHRSAEWLVSAKVFGGRLRAVARRGHVELRFEEPPLLWQRRCEGGAPAAQRAGPPASAPPPAQQPGTTIPPTLHHSAAKCHEGRERKVQVCDAQWMHAEAVVQRWDAAQAGRSAGAHAQYQEQLVLAGDEHDHEPAFPARMPWFHRHTSRLSNQAHAAALMRLRCYSTDLAAKPNIRAAGSAAYPHCPGGDQTAKHALLDCASTAPLRTLPQFAPLFMGPMLPPAEGRLHLFVHTPHQFLLAKNVHTCKSHWPPSNEPALGS